MTEFWLDVLGVGSCVTIIVYVTYYHVKYGRHEKENDE